MGSLCLSLMEDELFRAAVKGDLRVFSDENTSNHGEAYYTDQTTPKGNTIIHIAAEHGRADFIKEALARFPELSRSKNNNMDTPLHVAAMRGDEKIVELLASVEGCATKDEEEVNWPWMARNLQGDTPLHLALTNKKLSVVMRLLDVGSTLALSLVNASQETPLHIFLKYCVGANTTADALLEEGVLNLQGEYNSKGHIYTQRSSSMIVKDVLTELLKYKRATCMSDADGLTPLLIAAQQRSFMALRLILHCCPQSAEVSDHQGRTALHLLKGSMIIPPGYYWELKELLNLPEINAIKSAKDSLGNTPAHVAVANRDFALVRVLFECFADFTIKNKDGVSAIDLIRSFPDFASKMEEVMVAEKVLCQPLAEKLIEAVEKGTLFQEISPDVDIESGAVTYAEGHDCFLGRTEGGLSILHLAVRHGQKTVVEEVIKHFPSLVLTADSSGETPLHFGARLKKNHYPMATTLLQLSKDVVDEFRAEAGPLFLDAVPWRQKNSNGDTPLHEALRSSNYDMAVNLMDIDSDLSLSENRAGETPLHILARYGTYTKSDKIGALVKQLLGQNDIVIHKRDASGFIPLLRAAYCGRIRVVYWIVQNCPSSVQFRDANGRTLLHLLRLEPTAELDYMTIEDMLYVYRNILKLTSGAEFDGLRRSQDHDGNTPLHLALKIKNFAAAKFLLLWCIESEARQEMNIIDNNGHSVSNLLESLAADDTPYVKELKDLGLLAQKSIKEEAFSKKMMSSEVYTAAVKGDMNLFNHNQRNHTRYSSFNTGNGGDNDPISLANQVAPDGSNILHIALQHDQQDFAEKVIEKYPDLIFERNCNGDTPLHTAAKRWDIIMNHDCFGKPWKEACREYDCPEGLLIIPPWRTKNSKGNTPLHEATKTRNRGFVLELMKFDSQVTTYANHAGETPLHIATNNQLTVQDLLNRNKSAAYMRDREGLTPLLRASQVGNTHAANEILEHSPESIQLKDHRGRSFLHHLNLKDDALDCYTKQLYQMPQVDALRKTEDFDGNTPLHAAILDANSVGAKLLVNQFIKEEDYWSIRTQVKARNDEGESVLDLLATHDDAPTEVMELLNKAERMDVKGFYAVGGWVRSSYGVCKSQIKDMANTLSVVAGLLATITFAAAFQVPGGFDGDNGNPILLRRTAFQVFLISNTFAMCGSMIVLFSLLWVMSAGSVTNSFLLLDLAIAILQLCFGATLMSFMTGVYVATSHNALWLAAFTCALCSSIIVLMRKQFILGITRFARRLLRTYHLCKEFICDVIFICHVLCLEPLIDWLRFLM